MHSSICGRIPLSGDLPTCFLNNPRLLSPIRHSFQFFRVPGALHSDLCRGDIELPEIIRNELDGNRSDVLFKALQFRGAGNRDDPGFLCKEPGERELSGCRILLRGECSIRSTRARFALRASGEKRGKLPRVSSGSNCVFSVIVPSEEPPAKRTERNKADAKFFKRGNDFLVSGRFHQSEYSL